MASAPATCIHLKEIEPDGFIGRDEDCVTFGNPCGPSRRPTP
jgi:hypothetical protein